MTESGGSSLHAALIGVEDLRRSIEFYQDEVGLTLLDSIPLSSSGLAQHWRLEPDERGSATVLGRSDCDVGRIMLVDSSSGSRVLIRNSPGQRHFGLINLNFYTEDIHEHTRQFAVKGWNPWTDPIQHAMQASVGAPTEVMLEGPDGVIINLIELTSTDPTTRIGIMRRYVKHEFGYNTNGLTPVVTTQQCVPHVEAAARFYQDVLGMRVLHDDLLDKEDQNRFMDYPPDGRTRVIFMRGSHLFGKLALAQPLNFECDSLAARAVPGNIGYFAQGFVVDDLARAINSALDLSVEVYAERMQLEFPGLGNVESAVVRVPGSGALVQLIQRI